MALTCVSTTLTIKSMSQHSLSPQEASYSNQEEENSQIAAQNDAIETNPEYLVSESLASEKLLACPYLRQLKERRFENSSHEANQRMSQLLTFIIGNGDGAPDRISKITVNLSGGESWLGLSYKDFYQMEGLGMTSDNMKDLADDDANTSQAITLQHGSESLSIQRGSDGRVTIELQAPDDHGSYAQSGLTEIGRTADMVFQSSGAYSKLKDLGQRIERGQHDSNTAVVNDIPIQDEPLETLSVWQELGFISIRVKPELLSNEKTIIDSLDDLILDRLDKEINSDRVTVKKAGRGIETTLHINTQTNQYSISIKKDPGYFYAELSLANHEAVPFIDTTCAAEILFLLSENNLKLNRYFEDEITRIGASDRYGSVYTQISREIAKWVMDPKRPGLTNLLDLVATTESDAAASHQTKELIMANSLQQVDASKASRPTQLIFELMQACLGRIVSPEQSNSQANKTLPATNRSIEMRDGACFDVTSFYIASMTRGLLNKYSENNISMLKKLRGAYTYLLGEPATIKGVVLPPGALLSRQEDGTWAFLRLTPFCFETKEDIDATGSEMVQASIEQLHATSGTIVTLDQLKSRAM